MPADLPPIVRDWIPRQRWFAGKGRAPRLVVLDHRQTAIRPGTHLDEWLVDDDADPMNAPYYVPVTVHSTPQDAIEHARIGGGSDEVYRYDAPHDAVFSERLLLAATTGSPGGARRARASTVLGGEQSNTSVLYWTSGTPDDGPPDVILKVFRRLADGENPDVVLQTALSAAGVTRVPRALGSATYEWRDRVGLARRAHVSFVQEFVSGVEDAWRVVLRALAVREDVTTSLRDLGGATAEVHTALARLFPTDPPSPERIGALIGSMRDRAEAAAGAVPELAPLRERLDRIYSRLPFTPWPPLQRVHGDYHLGQVLLAPERGWLLLDFEGEPLRPLSERSENDVPLRDVAGMLRSLDYVAAASTNAGHPVDPAWTDAARSAFIAGYNTTAETPVDPADPLLRALELDKAVYEALYEAGNRPDWLPIPMAAIARLLGTES